MENTSYSDILRCGNDSILDELHAYKLQILDALNDPENNLNCIFDSCNDCQNAMILSAMLESCDEISMYCGELSIFRKGFYRQMESKYPGLGIKIRHEIRCALKRYIDNKSNRLNIILAKFDSSYSKDLILKSLKESKSSVTIKEVDRYRLFTSLLTNRSIGMKNNSVVISRREVNSDMHSSRCIVNPDKRRAEDVTTLMDSIEEASLPVIL